MGGRGSGVKTCKKTTVEECLTLTMKRLVGAGEWQDGQTGTITWTWRGGGSARIGFRFDLYDGCQRVWLSYVVTDAADEKRSYNYPVSLASDPCRFGGRQWYFRCPGEACGRRVRQLHKPGDGPIFACRNCHNLTYTSVQEHDNRIKRLREDPDALQRAAHGSNSDLMLAMKAFR